VALGVTIATAAITLTVFLEHGDNTARLIAPLCMTALVFIAAAHVQRPVVVCANFFLFLVEATSVNFVGATDYFYTAQCSDTPRFSYTFYVTCTLLLGALFSLVGLACFRAIDHWPLKSVFSTLAAARVALAAAEVAQAARWNVGTIDDRTFFVFGEAIMQPVVSMMFFMPMVILTSRLVDKEAEALTYAILAGTQNFGGLVGAALGAYFTAAYDIKVCEFERLPFALVVGHMTLPLVLIPAAHLLLPNVSVGAKDRKN